MAKRKLDARSVQALMRNIDKGKLAIALKGASETVREFFFSNMSTRSAKMLVNDMQEMGPVRLRDVNEAQTMPCVLRGDATTQHTAEGWRAIGLELLKGLNRRDGLQ